MPESSRSVVSYCPSSPKQLGIDLTALNAPVYTTGGFASLAYGFVIVPRFFPNPSRRIWSISFPGQLNIIGFSPLYGLASIYRIILRLWTQDLRTFPARRGVYPGRPVIRKPKYTVSEDLFVTGVCFIFTCFISLTFPAVGSFVFQILGETICPNRSLYTRQPCRTDLGIPLSGAITIHILLLWPAVRLTPSSVVHNNDSSFPVNGYDTGYRRSR